MIGLKTRIKEMKKLGMTEIKVDIETLEGLLEQSPETGQVDAIVMCSVSEMGAIAKIATEKRELEYAINGFHENPPKFSMGDVRVILEALNKVKRT